MTKYEHKTVLTENKLKISPSVASKIEAINERVFPHNASTKSL